MRKLFDYLNPVAHFGKKKYSFLFPFFGTVIFCLLSEVYCYSIAEDPMAVGAYAIFLFTALIIYFAFRDGMRGGFTACTITILYFFYIIYTRNYTGAMLTAGISTTIILGLLYFFIAAVIGWLKQKIDQLIEREADEKRRLQAIVEQLPVGILITDKNGKIIQGNKQIEKILGRKMRDGLIAGKDTLTTAHALGKIVSAKQWPLAQTLATGKPVVGKEFTFEQPHGKKAHVQISASVIRNSEGNVIAAASIVNDVTHQKELEERKDEFVNMASHELKTPITSLKLYTESLMRRIEPKADDRVTKIVLGITYQTERLQDLVSDLLDLSRLQTGKLFFSKETFAMEELIKETIEGLQETTKLQEIEFSGNASVTVHADRFRMYQVLTNLITNAIKYSSDGNKIIIRLKKSQGKAVISVQDFGIGISKDQQSKIFDRLYQVADAKGKTFPGLGMGLYISKEIVKRHKGNIWVESEKGKGATFFFTLPLKRQNER